MTERLRSMVPATLVAVAAIWAAWAGFGVQTMGDFPQHYAPAMNALLAGHPVAFLAQLPADGASGWLLVSAPAALVGKLLVGGQLAMFRFAALVCMLAVGGLGLWLAREMHAAGRGPLARAAVITVCVIAPALLDAIFYGHPEEPLGAALCVAAVLLAGGNRTTLAAVALAVALINKPWAVFAIPPVLLAAPSRKLELGLLAGAIVAAWTGAAYLASPANFARELHAASEALVAHPVDLWWPLAHLVAPANVTPAYFPPRLVSSHARELAVVLALPLSVPLARRGTRSSTDCLALLALLFLVRCLLDPSNHVYYQVPFVISLCAWEARRGAAPTLALVATVGFWLVFHTISGIASLDVQFAAYMVLTLPLAAILGFAVLRGQTRPSSTRGYGALSPAYGL
jgi:hypothetical protein